jgi:hypothetical protein
MGVGIRCLQSWRVHGDGDQPITTGHARKIPAFQFPSAWAWWCSRLAASEFRESEAAYCKLRADYTSQFLLSM